MKLKTLKEMFNDSSENWEDPNPADTYVANWAEGKLPVISFLARLLRDHGDCVLTPPTERIEVACRDCGSISWREIDKQPEQPKPEPEDFEELYHCCSPLEVRKFELLLPTIERRVKRLIDNTPITEHFCQFIEGLVNKAIKQERARLVRAVRSSWHPDLMFLLKNLADKLEQGEG